MSEAPYAFSQGSLVASTWRLTVSASSSELWRTTGHVRYRPAAAVDVYDENFLRSAALASAQNAQDYIREAVLLMDNGHYGRTQSLAILGKEEVGKALMLGLGALDAVPGLRALISDPRYRGIADHNLKQLLADLAGHAEYIVDEYASNVADEVPEAGGLDLESWLASFVEQCVAAAEGHLRDPKSAWRVQQVLKRTLNDVLARFRHTPRLPRSQTPDEKKMAGLYIDISGGVLSKPTSITESDARSAVADLSATLECLRRFQRALEEDGLWSSLVARYRTP